MEIILSHNNLDCDGLAAVLTMSRLRPQAIPVLVGSLNRNVRDLLARYEGVLRHVRLRDLPKRSLQRIILVDAPELPTDEALQRLLERDKPEIEMYDHHPLSERRPPGAVVHTDDIGATTTLLVEEMQRRKLCITPAEATILILGIYEDTGHLTYKTTTPRDARAAAWLLEQGADLAAVIDLINRPLSLRQRAVYDSLHANMQMKDVSGYSILLAAAEADDYVEEISTLAHNLTNDYQPDATFVLVQMGGVVQVIARSRNEAIDVGALLRPLGGGGHASAAAALVRDRNLEDVRAGVWDILRRDLTPAVSAGEIMTRDPHTINVGATIDEADAALRRYGHESLPILEGERLVGLIMRRDVDKAMQHGLGGRPVEAFAAYDMPVVGPRATLIEIQDAMQQNNVGQLPVLDRGRLVGIVTRTDVMRRWGRPAGTINLRDRLDSALSPDVLNLLRLAGKAATEIGCSLYLVGGLVRDLLLGLPNLDLDLVVEGDAIALAGRLRTEYGGRTKSHTRFGTAKWIVSPGDGLSLAHPVALDFVTARTEFYEHPAALPEVEASSLQHDLYRRDFTINTMAICLNQSRYGELVDFYGGKADLDRRLIRVLHNLSFIDDATRILRAARLAQRLGFAIEERTASLIADALGSLDRISGDRLRHELRLLFQETEPERTIKLLDELGVLRRLHPNLRYTPWLAGRYAALRGGLATWRSWGWGNGGRGGDEATAMLAAYASILAYWLSREELSQFMNRLNIAGEVGFVMRQVWEARATAVALANGAAPSQIYRLLKPYVIEAIVVMYITEPSQTVREAIASYVDELRHVRTEVDGLTLKSLGVAPGPLYSKLLQAVLDARLDGNVSNRAQEEYLLRRLLSAGPD